MYENESIRRARFRSRTQRLNQQLKFSGSQKVVTVEILNEFAASFRSAHLSGRSWAGVLLTDEGNLGRMLAFQLFGDSGSVVCRSVIDNNDLDRSMGLR